MMVFHMAVCEREVGTSVMPISWTIPPHGFVLVIIAKRADVKGAAVAGSGIQKDENPSRIFQTSHCFLLVRAVRVEFLSPI